MSHIRRLASATSLSTLLMLSACGGANDTLIASVGGGGPAGAGGAFIYQPFSAPTVDTQYDSALVIKTTDRFFSGDQVFGNIQYNAARATYTVGAFGFPLEDFPRENPAAPSPRDFYVGRGPAGSTGLTYTQFAYWFNNTPGVSGDYRAVLGVKTQRGDIPATGTATYRQVAIQGTAYQSGGTNDGIYSIGNSKVSLSLDFATVIASTRIELIGTPRAGGADVAFGIYTGADNTFPLFREGVPGDFAGFWDVAFYGPRAQEYGLNFSINQRFNGVQINAAGIVAGTRN